MRNLLMALVVVALVAAPSMATMTAQLVFSNPNGDGTLDIGQTATIGIQLQGSTKAPGQLGGSVDAAGLGKIVSSDFTWITQFTAAIAPASGSALANGGWGGFGSAQAMPNVANGVGSWWQVASFTVTGMEKGLVNLALVPVKTAGYGPLKSVATPIADSVVGTITGASFTVTPEPITMALLAMGGLFIARRRNA